MARVLMLEDSDALATAIIVALEEDGHSVMLFRSVRQARHAIPPIGFDVLLCDYELPDGTGLDFLREVGSLDRWTTILWSGLDRLREVSDSGVAVDHVLLKDDPALVFAIVAEAQTPWMSA